jgi:hypothetical protein
VRTCKGTRAIGIGERSPALPSHTTVSTELVYGGSVT